MIGRARLHLPELKAAADDDEYASLPVRSVLQARMGCQLHHARAEEYQQLCRDHPAGFVRQNLSSSSIYLYSLRPLLSRFTSSSKNKCVRRATKHCSCPARSHLTVSVYVRRADRLE